MSTSVLVRFVLISFFLILWQVVVHEDAVGGPLHVLELAALDRPQEKTGDNGHEDQTERDEEVEDIHGFGKYLPIRVRLRV